MFRYEPHTLCDLQLKVVPTTLAVSFAILDNDDDDDDDADDYFRLFPDGLFSSIADIYGVTRSSFDFRSAARNRRLTSNPSIDR